MKSCTTVPPAARAAIAHQDRERIAEHALSTLLTLTGHLQAVLGDRSQCDEPRLVGHQLAVRMWDVASGGLRAFDDLERPEAVGDIERQVYGALAAESAREMQTAGDAPARELKAHAAGDTTDGAADAAARLEAAAEIFGRLEHGLRNVRRLLQRADLFDGQGASAVDLAAETLGSLGLLASRGEGIAGEIVPANDVAGWTQMSAQATELATRIRGAA